MENVRAMVSSEFHTLLVVDNPRYERLVWVSRPVATFSFSEQINDETFDYVRQDDPTLWWNLLNGVEKWRQ